MDVRLIIVLAAHCTSLRRLFIRTVPDLVRYVVSLASPHLSLRWLMTIVTICSHAERWNERSRRTISSKRLEIIFYTLQPAQLQSISLRIISSRASGVSSNERESYDDPTACSTRCEK